MKFLKLIAIVLLSVLWILLLDRPLASVPAIGKFFNPFIGFWTNAEPVRQQKTQLLLPEEFQYKKVQILLDSRAIPHITAKNDADLYFAQGYTHAYYRLWQMDLQTRAAAGRLSEIIGEKTITYDRQQRRKGMVWAAESTLAYMEKDSITKVVLDAYTAGVNAYIHSLRYEDFPIEYKLMNFEPEEWTNLKISLMMKSMADDLTGHVNDLPLSYLRSALSLAELEYLFPEKNLGADPVIPSTTIYPNPTRQLPSVPGGSVFVDFPLQDSSKEKLSSLSFQRDADIGSNNWAVQIKDSNSNTIKTILANDPHLSLNLPSIWFENQMTTKDVNCYGVSLPGTPGVIIGFNDSLSWGVTNNYRDVKDFYEIVSEDPRFYVFDKKEIPFNFRVEVIGVKDEPNVFDTVRYSIHGPLQYDSSFPEPSGSGKTLAVSWMAHRPSNELKSLYLVNRANNYKEFEKGISLFTSPAQNFVYADRQGNIAIWGQGQFINKWKGQGRFVMRGDISSTLWRGEIPVQDNPHIFNPPFQNYLASANQTVTTNAYPYWYNGDFSEFRSWIINDFLMDSLQMNVQRTMKMQTNTFSYLAKKIAPLYFKYGENEMSKHPEYFTKWDFDLQAESKVASAFQIWWFFLYKNIWEDDFQKFPLTFYPKQERTMQIILSDSSSIYIDDQRTKEKENLAMIAQRCFQQTWDSISVLEKNGGSEWYKVKNTSVTHLAKIEAFSFTGLKTGGWGNTINAMGRNHGPTWRMIVEMKPESIQAFGTYSGGQSGNPGSKHYADFLSLWIEGKYDQLNFIPKVVEKKKAKKEE